MKFWIGVFTIAVLTFLVLRCQINPLASTTEDTASDCTNTWLKNIEADLKQNTAVKSEIIQYQYNGQVVYYVDSCIGCPDGLTIVYSCNGDVICQFGGIAGLNTCLDFAEKAIKKKVIWKN
jgi:hypothetical protein